MDRETVRAAASSGRSRGRRNCGRRCTPRRPESGNWCKDPMDRVTVRVAAGRGAVAADGTMGVGAPLTDPQNGNSCKDPMDRETVCVAAGSGRGCGQRNYGRRCTPRRPRKWKFVQRPYGPGDGLAVAGWGAVSAGGTVGVGDPPQTAKIEIRAKTLWTGGRRAAAGSGARPRPAELWRLAPLADPEIGNSCKDPMDRETACVAAGLGRGRGRRNYRRRAPLRPRNWKFVRRPI